MNPEERTELIEAMKAIFPTRDEMNARFDQVPTRDEMNARFDLVPTRDEMMEAGAEWLRRYEVTAEEMRSIVQGLAEGIQGISQQIKDLREERDASRAEALDPLRAGYRYLDHRVDRLERKVFGEPGPPPER